MAYMRIQKPHSDGQKAIILSSARDIVLAGRRWGKTHAGTQRLLKGASSNSGGLYWWVGLSWKAASMNAAWKQLIKYHEQVCRTFNLVPKEHRSMQKYELYFPNESIIQMRTAENPESLAGEAVDGVVFDEFTMARESVWTEQLAPTLMTTDGWAMLIGVPKSMNWGARLWNKARELKGWNPWHFTTYDNPYIKKSVIDELSESMTEQMVRQEIMAEIIEGKGTVFRHITECTSAKWIDEPEEGRIYVAGIDWARKNDYTVVTIMDVMSREVVHYHRIGEIDYPTQLDMVKELHKKFNFQRIIAEENSMGGPMVEQLAKDGLPIEPFSTQDMSKRMIIEDLAIAFETEVIGIPLDETMIDELQSFEVEFTSTGTPRYRAPKGLHDDIVMSLAFCYHAFAYKHRI